MSWFFSSLRFSSCPLRSPLSVLGFPFSVFVLGLLDHGGWTRLVFRYQRSSLENQFEPTHVGCHLISALVLCVWRPGIGCSLLDVGCFRLPRSVLRSALSSSRPWSVVFFRFPLSTFNFSPAPRLALCTALLYHFAVNLQMPLRDDLGMIPLAYHRCGSAGTRTARRNPAGDGFFQGRPILRGKQFRAVHAAGDVHHAAGGGTKKFKIARQCLGHDETECLFRWRMDECGGGVVDIASGVDGAELFAPQD